VDRLLRRIRSAADLQGIFDGFPFMHAAWRVRLFYKRNSMTTGTVKWFNPTKGFGFIEPDDGGRDAFVHISAVEKAGLTGLFEGQKVEYELVPGRDGRAAADNLKVIE
jgi:CspA family cold shock protein